MRLSPMRHRCAVRISPGLSRREYRPARPEEIVSRSWIALLLMGFVYAFSIPFFALSLLIAAGCSAATAIVMPIRKHTWRFDSDLRKNWAANEFGFERAIEAYEELLDEFTLRGQ